MRRLKAKSSLEGWGGYLFMSTPFLFIQGNFFFKLRVTECEPGMQYFLTGLLPELSQLSV